TRCQAVDDGLDLAPLRRLLFAERVGDVQRREDVAAGTVDVDLDRLHRVWQLRQLVNERLGRDPEAEEVVEPVANDVADVDLGDGRVRRGVLETEPLTGAHAASCDDAAESPAASGSGVAAARVRPLVACRPSESYRSPSPSARALSVACSRSMTSASSPRALTSSDRHVSPDRIASFAAW